MHKRSKSPAVLYICAFVMTLLVLLLCISVGSVWIPFSDIVKAILGAAGGKPAGGAQAQTASIILNVRLPRVLTVALVGAALSVCGAAMQGLLKNPLADGSTLGVSSGATLGAVLAIAFGVRLPGGMGSVLLSILFAFGSIALILSLAHCIDYSLSTNTIILTGVIFSMFAGSATSLLVTFSGDRVKNVMAWTMGSFSGSGAREVLLMGCALLGCGAILLRLAPELNAFAVGEDNARHIGVNVRGIRLTVMVTVSVLIGVSVSVSGTIGFVGLVIPHIVRLLTGPNHKRLLPASLFFGAIFLLLADLISRVIFSPVELPVGVVTSFVGSIVFIYIFYRSRRGR